MKNIVQLVSVFFLIAFQPACQKEFADTYGDLQRIHLSMTQMLRIY